MRIDGNQAASLPESGRASSPKPVSGDARNSVSSPLGEDQAQFSGAHGQVQALAEQTLQLSRNPPGEGRRAAASGSRRQLPNQSEAGRGGGICAHGSDRTGVRVGWEQRNERMGRSHGGGASRSVCRLGFAAHGAGVGVRSARAVFAGEWRRQTAPPSTATGGSFGGASAGGRRGSATPDR